MRLIAYQRRRKIGCAFASILLLVQQSRGQDVADDVPISLNCDASNCLDCLNVGCGWFPLGGDNGQGECVDTCSVIADAPCYSEASFAGSSPQTICNRVMQDEADNLLCSSITDCRTCTTTSKGDAISMCVWYDISSTCGQGLCLSLVGCGSLSCPANGEPVVSSPPSLAPTPLNQDDASICDRSSVSCDACLGSGCAWTPGGLCLESCSIIADIACYDNATFVNVTDATEICARAEVEDSDASLCLAQTNCSTCTSVPLSIAGRSCIWYEVENDPSISSCCLACDVPGTPTTTCQKNDDSVIPPTVSGAECNANATSCADCLSSSNTTCLWFEAKNQTGVASYCRNSSDSSTEHGTSQCNATNTTNKNNTAVTPGNNGTDANRDESLDVASAAHAMFRSTSAAVTVLAAMVSLTATRFLFC
jgi:hypothetical protein